jgi:virginiamycin B lyase
MRSARLIVSLAATLFVSCTNGPSVPPPSTAPTPSSRSPVGVASTLKRPMTELRKQATAVVSVGGAPHAPDWQVAAFGAVWVSNEARNLIQRIDPHTNRVVAAIHVNVPCDGLGAGFGSVWVPSCAGPSILRIDPRTDRIVAKIETTIAGVDHGGEGLIDVGEGGVWLMTTSDTLSRIDPATNKIATNVSVVDGSFAVAVGAGSIWATSWSENKVTRVDPAGKVLATIDVGPSPLFLAAGEGAVWVLNQGDGSVARIDPSSNAVTRIAASSAGEGGCIAAGLGAVWVTIPGAPLTRIDPATDAVTEQFVGQGGDCLSVGYRSVWLSNHEFGNVWRIDPS